MLSKVVMLLTETELRDWRNGWSPKVSSCQSPTGSRSRSRPRWRWPASATSAVTNSAAWKNGLKPLKAKGSNAPPRDNYYLPDATILAIVRECYVEDADFGALIDMLAGTGVREIARR